MLKEFRYNLNLFRQICCCFVLFFAFFSLFTLCGTLPLEVEFSPKGSTLKSSLLADFPGDKTDDEAAVLRDAPRYETLVARLKAVAKKP